MDTCLLLYYHRQFRQTSVCFMSDNWHLPAMLRLALAGGAKKGTASSLNNSLDDTPITPANLPCLAIDQKVILIAPFSSFNGNIVGLTGTPIFYSFLQDF